MGGSKQTDHTHDWFDDGVRFRTGYQLPGSGAHALFYYRIYRCRSCLDALAESMGGQGNDYSPPRYGATTATEKERQAIKALGEF